MKIRIKDNSIRFRLTRSEVEAFSTTGLIEARTQFKESVFRYALKSRKDINSLSADFTDECITLYLPETESKGWKDSDRVGYENTLPLPGGENLSLLLEKDFVCMDETTEDQSDNYPNPKIAE